MCVDVGTRVGVGVNAVGLIVGNGVPTGIGVAEPDSEQAERYTIRKLINKETIIFNFIDTYKNLNPFCLVRFR